MKTILTIGGSLLFSQSLLAATIQGTVLNQNSQPISGAEISIHGGKIKTMSDAEGKFSLDNPHEHHELHIEADGFSHQNVKLKAGQAKPLTIQLVPSVFEVIDVRGVPLHASKVESAMPVSVLSGDELRDSLAPNLGDTLKNQPGIHSSYFGPVASSPIIRGLGGSRVLITQNGLDASDASRVGPDHVVSTEAVTAQQIEILRGPATLFYGSGAIGGVVNVVDQRVPTSNETEVAVQANHNTVADENEVALSVTGGTGNIAVHVDGFWRDGDDYKIPGEAELHDHENETAEEHAEHEDEPTGILANSASEASGVNLGASYLLDNGYVGVSYGRLDREYGIPGHHHHHESEEHGEEENEEQVYGDMQQDRWQLLSELHLDGDLLTDINSKLSYTDYQHAEIEGGEVGTTFNNETLEGKLDLLFSEIAGWHSSISLNYKGSDFDAVGEEAFTPPSETESFASAFLTEKHFGDFLVQLGARVEQVDIEATIPEEHDEEEAHEHEHEEHVETFVNSQDFTPVSLSAGVTWDFAQGYNLGLSLTRAQRAPSAGELFSNGAHIGSGAYEVGALNEIHLEEHEHEHEEEAHEEYEHEVHIEFHGDNAELETSNNIDLSLRKFEGDFGFIVNLFYNSIDDYYYLANTGLQMAGGHHHHDEDAEHHDEELHMDDGAHHDDEGLPLFHYQQADVELYGLEAEFAWQVSEPLKLSMFADTVRGHLKSGSDLPRLPPSRIGTQLNFEQQAWDAELSWTHYFSQTRLAEFETRTDGYDMLGARFNYYLQTGEFESTIFLKAQNLLDEEARVHSSFLKDKAPLPGRGFVLGFRAEY